MKAALHRPGDKRSESHAGAQMIDLTLPKGIPAKWVLYGDTRFKLAGIENGVAHYAVHDG